MSVACVHTRLGERERESRGGYSLISSVAKPTRAYTTYPHYVTVIHSGTVAENSRARE